jgi:hypothetical protein
MSGARKRPTINDRRRQGHKALAGASGWIKIFFDWRPRLRDEGDNRLFELAMAGCAKPI